MSDYFLLSSTGLSGLAETVNDVDPTSGTINEVGQLLNLVVNIAIGIGFSLSVLFLVVAGIKFVTSRGDFKAVDSAKRSLTYAMVALILSFMAVTLRYAIFNTFGIDQTNFF